jgi:gluconate kinase
MTTSALESTIDQRLAKGDDLHVQAETCRQLARLALTERNRLFWLRLAEEWVELARTADRRSTAAGMALPLL